MWYDIFSLFYDRSLESLYRPARESAVAALRPGPGSLVLDLACGTGQNFPVLMEALGQQGGIVGVDRSGGMLRQARKRVQRAGWTNVSLVQRDVHALDADALAQTCQRQQVDAILCTLGFTAFTDWEEVFRRSFALLRPGGRYAILDVVARERSFQTTSVELVARADLSREVWRPLEAAVSDFEIADLPGDPRTFGGQLFVATGTRA